MKEIIFYALGFIGLIVVIALLLGFPVMWLWNYLMPEIFGLKEINFWQALCMTLLAQCLFKQSSSSSKKES